METLEAQYRDLAGGVGNFLGYGRGSDNDEEDWDSRKQSAIDHCVKGGLRKVYYCGHDWSFLRPVATLTLDTGEQTVALPADFGGVEGKISVSTTSGTNWTPLDVTGIGTILNQYAAMPDSTGTPLLCCEETPKRPTHERGSRSQLRFFPIADQDYTVKFQYYINPDFISGNMPYVYGGPQHSETFLAACKATSEIDFDDMQQGPQFMEFMRVLEISKDIDRRNKPQLFGYNGDRSDQLHTPMRHPWRGISTVTFNGVAYD